LVYGEGLKIAQVITDPDQKLHSLLQRCRTRNLKLNREKVHLRLTEVKLVSHPITIEGLNPDRGKYRAILEMPILTVQRYMGTGNYLSRFMPSLSEVAAPLRKLTHKDCHWPWTDAHDQAITQIKEIISHDPVLRYYDPQLELTLQCDAS